MMTTFLSTMARAAGSWLCIVLLAGSETARAQGGLSGESLQRLPNSVNQRLQEVPRRIVRKTTETGYVDLQWGGGNLSTIRSQISPSNKALCLTTEEVKGRKIESEVILAAPDEALKIIPGGVFDSYQLLKSGAFKYLKWGDRKPYSLSINSNLAKRKTASVPSGGSLNNPFQGQKAVTEAAAYNAVMSLTTPLNFIGNPSIGVEKSFSESTFRDSFGISIGASFFYLIGSGDTAFNYLSDSRKNILTVSSYQPLVAVMADSFSSPQDLFNDTTGLGPDALLIREVQYGRRLYVTAETQSNSKAISQSFQASVNALLAGGSVDETFKDETFERLTNVKVVTFGGDGSAVSAIGSPEDLKKAIDRFIASPYQTTDIVPLSYKVSDLNGNPVSLTANAFLNSENCLRSGKMRVWLRSLTVVKANDGNDTEEIYGSLNINLYNPQGKLLSADGITPQPVLFSGAPALPSYALTVASKTNPKELRQGVLWEPEQRYVDINVSNLNNRLQILPSIKEEDNISDDTFTTDDKFNLKLRTMLLEGRTRQIFELRDGGSELQLDIEIEPR